MKTPFSSPTYNSNRFVIAGLVITTAFLVSQTVLTTECMSASATTWFPWMYGPQVTEMFLGSHLAGLLEAILIITLLCEERSEQLTRKRAELTAESLDETAAESERKRIEELVVASTDSKLSIVCQQITFAWQCRHEGLMLLEENIAAAKSLTSAAICEIRGALVSIRDQDAY